MKILITKPIDSDAIKEPRKRHDVVCEFLHKTDLLRSLIPYREGLVFRSGVSITADVMQSALSITGDLDALTPLAVLRVRGAGLSIHDRLSRT